MENEKLMSPIYKIKHTRPKPKKQKTKQRRKKNGAPPLPQGKMPTRPKGEGERGRDGRVWALLVLVNVPMSLAGLTTTTARACASLYHPTRGKA